MFYFYSALENLVDLLAKENSQLRGPSSHKQAEKSQKGLTLSCPYHMLQQHFQSCRIEVWAKQQKRPMVQIPVCLVTQRPGHQSDVLSISWSSTCSITLWTLGLRKKSRNYSFECVMTNVCCPRGSRTEPVSNRWTVAAHMNMLSLPFDPGSGSSSFLWPQALADNRRLGNHLDGSWVEDWGYVWYKPVDMSSPPGLIQQQQQQQQP